ncbi:hypothetical protein KP509_12G015500 [Ceratopteris richardii]|uniref:Uncharacterized protein n=1 Tax=Ceratopteris richardii TaxID=49495 RepID=A0A8T2TIX3_CERRI|nr:hypothetical protein KP509_12G015500 [Ceratopteris richardii]
MTMTTMSSSCFMTDAGSCLYHCSSAVCLPSYYSLRLVRPLSVSLFTPSLVASLIKRSTEQLLDLRADSQTLHAVRVDVHAGLSTTVEADDSDDFVEIGLIRSTHGVKGELKVMSLTDFPEQRFETPGPRWVGFYRMGRLVGLRKFDLLSGRRIMQRKDSAWLLTFEGIDCIEKASEVLGATVFVKTADRPILDADQLYIPELIGMSVQLKDSGKVIGNIVDVFNSGANDLLRIKLSHTCDDNEIDVNGRNENLVWIPFVKEIVPTVDKENKFIEIDPPEGLLELNLPLKRQKHDVRKESLRNRRKLQGRLSGVRKKLMASKQDHILSGLAQGDAGQREALKMQLLTMDFTLFKRAVETLSADFKASLDSSLIIFSSAIAASLDWKGLNEWFHSSPKRLEYSSEVNECTWRSWCQGLRLIANNRVAIVALTTGVAVDADLVDSSFESNLKNQAMQMLTMQELAKTFSAEKPLIPWVIVTTESSSEYVQNVLEEESYFGLSEQQVHFITLSCLPVVRYEGEDDQRILMESKWKIAASAGGEGHVFGDLDDSGILDSLIGIGIDYIHICMIDRSSSINLDPAIFGMMEEQKTCVGIRVSSEAFGSDHGVLCIRKGSIDGRGRSIFIPESEKPVGSWKNINETFEHFTVSKAHDTAHLSFIEGNNVMYRVPLSCNYTLSTDYLKHLSLQRHNFIYEGEYKTHCQEYSVEGDLETNVNQENAVQLKCSLHNALMFCSTSKVTLFNYDMAGNI